MTQTTKTKATPEDVLDDLHELAAMCNRIITQRDIAIDDLLTPEQRAKAQKIREEAEVSYKAKIDLIRTLTQTIAEAVMARGASIRGTHLMAIFNSGRVSWDSKGLDGAMVMLPQLAAFRKQGESYMTLRKVEKKVGHDPL